MTNMEVQKKLITDMCTKSTHIAILGKRETGKTCLGYAILNWHKRMGNKECLVYNHPQPNLLPPWIRNITDLRYMTNNEVILIDESSNDFDKFSYAKQSNRYLMEKMKLARQTNTSFIFVDHSSDFLNKNMLKLIDIWMLKNNTEYAITDERLFIKRLYSRMERLPRLNEFWLHTDGFEGIMAYNKPVWYSDILSMAYDVHAMQVTNVDEIIQIKKQYGSEMAEEVEEILHKRKAVELADDLDPNVQAEEAQQVIKTITDTVKTLNKNFQKMKNTEETRKSRKNPNEMRKNANEMRTNASE